MSEPFCGQRFVEEGEDPNELRYVKEWRNGLGNDDVKLHTWSVENRGTFRHAKPGPSFSWSRLGATKCMDISDILSNAWKGYPNFHVTRGINVWGDASNHREIPYQKELQEKWIKDEADGLQVLTAYKKKADKVKPVDYDQSDGSCPMMSMQWKEDAIAEAKAKGLDKPREPHDIYFIPKFSTIEKGARLTPERVQKLNIGDFLTDREKDLLIGMLFNREAALSWTFEEKGMLKESVAPPQVIRTIPHKAWQEATFQPPKALTNIAVDMLKQRISYGVLEHCHGPYRNPWFLVKKKNGKYRLINAAMEINRVTIRDANLPPNVEDFVDDFAGLSCCSLLDLFSGYDQIALDKSSRDLTGFMTPLGLLRCKTLPMGATNSVSQFVRIMNGVLADHFPSRVRPFLDDIGVKGPRSEYNGEEVAPGVRRFVLEHLQWMDSMLADVERAGLTIHGEKSEFCVRGVKIVGFVCDPGGKRPSASKVIKIVEWGHLPQPGRSPFFSWNLCFLSRVH